MLYQSPGVYREEIFLKPPVPLATGIPGFVGFAEFVGAIAPGQIPSTIEIKRREEFEQQFQPAAKSYLGAAIAGFFENGGERCYVSWAQVPPSQPLITTEARIATIEAEAQALIAAVEALATVEAVDLVAIPDVATLIPEVTSLQATDGPINLAQVRTAALAQAYAVQTFSIQHCNAQQDRFALLDALPQGSAKTVLEQRDAIATHQLLDRSVNAALYYPWLINDARRAVPPCGHVAGIIARCDRTQGIFKAPANKVVKDVQALQTPIVAAVQNQLNPMGVNCFRALPGRGIRLWGARTLSKNPAWRYINTRRLFLTVGRWIERNMAWATFESNAPQLWVRIQRELTAYLTRLWRTGALQGNSADQAFFVKCDAETNPPEQREIGQVVTELGLAVTAPAEFLIVRITQRPDVTELA